MKSYAWSCSLWAFVWNRSFGMFRSGSLFFDVSLTALRLGSLFEINLVGVFHLGSFVLDPCLQSFIWDLSFGIRRLVSCLQTADHFLHSHTDTRTNKLGAHKTKKNRAKSSFLSGTVFYRMESHEMA